MDSLTRDVPVQATHTDNEDATLVDRADGFQCWDSDR